MKRYAIALQKKSYTGSIWAQWEFYRVKPFLNEVELKLEIKPKAVLMDKPAGGPVAFAAILCVIWDCEKWEERFIPVVEAWANGNLQISED